ncbi:hypothetical protein KY340_01700 [Candidatus Woesearchaeota archaeon]|nr:hypothetical protein [Candidatus Woesearchaeota archaeon]
MKKVMRLLFLLALALSMLLVTLTVASASYENDGYGHESWRYGYPPERAIYDYSVHRYYDEYQPYYWGKGPAYAYDYRYDYGHRHYNRDRPKLLSALFW